MNTSKNNKTANAVIIKANPANFNKVAPYRANRLVETLKPITDTWYPRFYKAAKEGSDAVIKEWYDYRHEYFYTVKRAKDEVFRFAALLVILRSIETESYVRDNGILYTTQAVVSLIADKTRDMAKYWYPRHQFENEADTIALANDIDTLDLEYPNMW